MNVETKIQAETPDDVVIVERVEDLAAIYSPECAAAIWQRSPVSVFQNWIDALDPDQLPDARLILQPLMVREAVENICMLSDVPVGPQRDCLIEDISALADIFAGMTTAPYLRLRLDVVKTNACRRFHVDAVTTRLICTYRGTGTQYGKAEDGETPPNIFTVPTCAPIILRGTQHPGYRDSRLRHRSPPIEGTGQTRLVLVLDPLESHEEEE